MIFTSSLIRRFGFISAVAVITLFAILYTARVYQFDARRNISWPTEVARTPQNITQDETKWLESHNLQYPIRYGCRNIETRVKRELKRASLTKVESSFFDGFQTVRSAEHYNKGSIECLEALPFSVPPYEAMPINASALSFGIQTTRSRLDATLSHLRRWLAYTSAKLYVVLVESEGVAASPAQISALEKKMRQRGLDATLLAAKPGDTFPQRYFSLIDILYEARTPQTDWIALIDDDTFFPSLPSLLTMLAQHDPSEEQYLGSLSEDWWAVSHYGYMAFGGAGIFLSVPLAAKLHPHAEECKNGLRTSAGDISVMDCVYAHSSAKLTPIPELHQVDTHGDISGLYESGRKHLSLHHWKDGSVFGKGLPMDRMHLVSDVCGDCFLQRWQFEDGTVLSNGYSIVEYRGGRWGQIDFDKMEHTWQGGVDVRHSLGPVRDRLELEKEKVQYVLLDSMKSGDAVRQLYLHKGVEGDADTVLELIWRAQR